MVSLKILKIHKVILCSSFYMIKELFLLIRFMSFD